MRSGTIPMVTDSYIGLSWRQVEVVFRELKTENREEVVTEGLWTALNKSIRPEVRLDLHSTSIIGYFVSGYPLS